MKKSLFLSTLVVSSLFFTESVMGQSHISESSVTMKTYGYDDPDPVANPVKAIYPYFRFDGFTTKASDKEWKTVELENQYIKLRIMPEIGGKVWGAIEKKSGDDFIYDNDVVKFRDIAMRGPWVSGGIEINFGIIGHAPWSSSPVDYHVRENSDGSVSCFVGTLDLITRAWWSCEIKLEQDKAYFTTSTKWYNPTLVDKPYYHWMNAGYDMTDQMELFFPGDNYIGHDGDRHDWPIDNKGRDISKYAENNFGSSKSYHVMGSVSDYYAAYWPEKSFGSAHYAPYGEKLGMKIFLWGLARSGMIWEDLLTDNSGQYVELQSGRLFNQETNGSANTPFKHFKFEGATCEQFTEYWYPIKNTAGVLTTNKYATINIASEDGKNMLYLSPLQSIDGDIIVKCDGKEVYKNALSLEPMQDFKAELPANLDGDIEVILGDNLLVYSQEYSKETSRPKQISKDFDANSLYGKYVAACQSVYVKDYDKAIRLLEQVLAEDGGYAPALNTLSAVYFSKGDYTAAKKLALRALAIDTYDADANIMYGLSSSYLGDSADAVDGFSVASISGSHRVAAYIGLAKEFAKRGMWYRVVEYATKIDKLESGNSDAMQLLTVAYRNLSEDDKAKEVISFLEQNEPLNHFARFESYLLQEGSAEQVSQMINSELKSEIYLEMGLWYESLGQSEDALELYAIAGDAPMILYRTAHVKQLMGDESYKDILAEASAASPAFVFPFRHESLEMLEWVVSQDKSWKPTYYLAILRQHLGYKEEALALMDGLGDTPDYAPFYITRSMLKSGDACIADLLKSESLDESWRIGSLLIKEYKKQGLNEQMLEAATKYKKLYGDDYRLGMAYVPVLVENKRYKEALKYLENVEIIPYEGANEGRTMYRDCNLFMALDAISKKRYKQAVESVEKSFIWIENLGVGKPYDEDIDNRTENYMLAYCYSKMGDKTLADSYYQKVADDVRYKNTNTILSVLAMRHLGREDDAKALLSDYKKMNNNQRVAEWAEAFYNGEFEKAENIYNSSDTKGRLGAFGANSFNDYNFITIVKEVVELM